MTKLGLIVLAAEICACGGEGDRVSAPPASADSAPPPVATLPADEAPYFPGSTWRTASPDEVGVPSDVLARVGQRLSSRTWRGLDSFIVIRRGYLVHEAYYTGARNDSFGVTVDFVVRELIPAIRR